MFNRNANTEDPKFLEPMIRLLGAVALGSLLILTILPLGGRLRGISTRLSFAERLQAAGSSVLAFALEAAVLCLLALAASAAIYYLLKKLRPWLETASREQARFLDSLDPRYLDLGIAASAALSLFLELAVIRWHGSVLEFLAFYKNFTLLACFAGLGLGYSLSSRKTIPLVLVIPMLGWQFGLMMAIQLVPGLFHTLPFREQLAMGFGSMDLPRVFILYGLLTVVFLITALTFLPIGQLCGRLMERRAKLRAYGLNLLGSLAGVVAMLAASFLWTPPLVWFGLCFLAIIAYHTRESRALFTGIVSSLVCAMILAWWPVNQLSNRVYSPYQLLEMETHDTTGLTLIRAAGHYYQRIFDLSPRNHAPELEKTRNYYDFPHKAHGKPGAEVAVVGAGTGNDVAAALRAGASGVDAIEIDPAIMAIGKMAHPENPYGDKRTRSVVDDARSFFRSTDRTYDMIAYGMLDSHTLLSHGSSVRLDSFVYTVEGLREARSRLKPDGMISLSFSVVSKNLGKKIYLMLQEAFDGRPPVCVIAGYDNAVLFFASNDKDWKLSPELVASAGFKDGVKVFADSAIAADVSTDDWPFFYMPQRVYPTSYLAVIFQILALSAFLGRSFMAEKPRLSHLPFFFLGVGFMLIETKGITEMGLTFGNTWHVIGVVIAGILIMAFLGNLAVDWFKIRRPTIPYLCLLAALAVGWLVARSGGFASTPIGRLETAIVLTCPLLFSGIVFSTLLTARGQISGMMAMNLLGAICGGLLEYNSMYFGFGSLYLMAMGCYALAFLSGFVFKEEPEPAEQRRPVNASVAASH